MDIINSILSFVLYFILDSLVIQLVYTLTDTEIRKKWQTSALIGLNGIIIVITLNRQYIENIGNISIILKRVILICFIIGRFFLYSAVFKKVSKQVLWVFLTTFATNQIYSNITKKITDSLYRVDLAYLIEIVFLAFAFFYIKKNKKEEIYKRIISSLPQKLYTLVLIILLIASIFVAAALRDDSGSIIQYFLLPSMVGLVVSTIAIIKIGISETEKKANIDVLSRMVESQVEYYDKINKIYGEFRSFRHDYKNHMLCLRGLIAADKIDEALNYMETMQDMSSVGKNKYNTGNVIIDALLDDKCVKAEKFNTKLVFSGIVPTSGISNADLCIIIANSIDNAIEACSKDETENEKEIIVDADFKQGYFFFRASNPMFEDVKFKGKNKVATSKSDKEHHGFGVANIVHTTEKYGGTVEISTDNGKFIIEVQLLLEQVLV